MYKPKKDFPLFKTGDTTKQIKKKKNHKLKLLKPAPIPEVCAIKLTIFLTF